MAKLILGVTGSIAAYKAAALASSLVKNGNEVHAILTQNACKFITPLTFQTVTGNRAVVDMFESPLDYNPLHVSLARDCELFIVAPASANILAKMASGIADDMLSTTFLSVDCPVLVAPAMHTKMWFHHAVQDNVKKLKAYGVLFAGPAEGRLASGDTGPGRMLEPEDILTKAQEILSGK